MTDQHILELEDSFAPVVHGLYSFDSRTRKHSVDILAQAVQEGKISRGAFARRLNMHCHTFFSFNAYGHSPSSLAWLANQEGFLLEGIVDFDVLDGVDEFLNACKDLGVRGTAGIETRVYIPEFASHELNSPGEPGIAYHMGIGFTSSQVPRNVQPVLNNFRDRVSHRNQVLIEKVNAFLDPVRIDYIRDVLPLTPGDSATERHIVVAYIQAAEIMMPDSVGFWAEKLASNLDDTASMMQDTAKFQNTLRSKLMKRGGPGYIQPAPDTFPALEDFHRLIVESRALPCFAWLDGTSSGENQIEELLDLMISKGVVAINIVPDRNWNIADPVVKKAKIKNLYDLVHLAMRLNLPINVGTEMNSFGNKIVDDFLSTELEPLWPVFLDGAYFVYGHTRLQQLAQLGYQSDWANANLPLPKNRNLFYTQIGSLIPPGHSADKLTDILADSMLPVEIIQTLQQEFQR
jgi:hypothetical protein